MTTRAVCRRSWRSRTASDLEVARSLRLPRGSIVAADRLYLDFEWLKSLDAQGVFLVTRLKRKIKYAVRERRSFTPTGVTSDQIIELTSVRGRARCPIPLRRVYRDPDTKKFYAFLTNNFKLAPKTIANISRSVGRSRPSSSGSSRMRIKSFVGTSRNAHDPDLDRHVHASPARLQDLELLAGRN